MRFIYLLIIYLFITTLSHAQIFNGSEEDIESILQTVEQFSAHVVNNEPAEIGAIYARNAKIFPNNRDIIEGRDPIIEYWTLPEDRQTVYHKIIPQEITIEGDKAIDHGYYEGETKMADGTRHTWKGKYVVIWHKIDGTWQIYLDIWNSLPQEQ